MKCQRPTEDEAFKKGFVDKDVLDATLLAHKAAIAATKSHQREEAEKFHRDNNLS